MSRFAWVTLATNDTYGLGALVLAHSLKRANTAHELAVLVTPGVTPTMRDQLSLVFNLVQEVDVLDSRDSANLALLARPDLGVTFTKLHCWRLTQYTKCVFLDADTLVVQNCDELFDREEFSAAPDPGWPDCFNSGVFVYKPSDETYAALVQFAVTHGSFDGGDQGLLNMFFKDWATKDISKHLPFIYNMCSTATYSYLPAFKYYGDKVKIVHFIGSSKPWLQVGTGVSSISGFVQYWWDLFQIWLLARHTRYAKVLRETNSSDVKIMRFYKRLNSIPLQTRKKEDLLPSTEPQFGGYRRKSRFFSSPLLGLDCLFSLLNFKKK